MKIKILSSFVFSFFIFFSAQAQKEQMVKIKIKGEDNYESVRMVDLIGNWKNVSGVQPILSEKALDGAIVIRPGNLVSVQDEWAADLPGNLQDLRWWLLDEQISFKSAAAGELEVSIEKLKDSNIFELTVNTFTYRKSVLRSDRKKKAQSLN